MKKETLLFVICILLKAMCFGQADSANLLSQKGLARGIYTSYEEYKNNAPSVDEPFTVTTIIKSKDDSTVIGANYLLLEGASKLDKPVWGFCDGRSVFVKFNNDLPLTIHFIQVPYWKLEGLGPYSYFNIYKKKLMLAGPNLMKIITGVLTVNDEIEMFSFVITPEGKFTVPDIRTTKKYLAAYPNLIKAFAKDAEQYAPYDYANSPDMETPEIYAAKMNLIKDYLDKLNKAMKPSD